MVKEKEAHTLKKILENISSEVPNALEKLKKSWKSLFSEKSAKEKRKRNPWAIFGLVCLNLLLVIWGWASIFAIIFSIFISGFSVAVSGLAIIISSLFVMILPVTFALEGLFISGLFAGIGVLCLGLIIAIFGWKFGKYFFMLTKDYLDWNNDVFSGRAR